MERLTDIQPLTSRRDNFASREMRQAGSMSRRLRKNLQVGWQSDAESGYQKLPKSETSDHNAPSSSF